MGPTSHTRTHRHADTDTGTHTDTHRESRANFLETDALRVPKHIAVPAEEDKVTLAVEGDHGPAGKLWLLREQRLEHAGHLLAEPRLEVGGQHLRVVTRVLGCMANVLWPDDAAEFEVRRRAAREMAHRQRFGPAHVLVHNDEVCVPAVLCLGDDGGQRKVLWRCRGSEGEMREW